MSCTFLLVLIVPLVSINYYLYNLLKQNKIDRLNAALEFGKDYILTVIHEKKLDAKMISRKLAEDARLLSILEEIDKSKTVIESQVTELLIEYDTPFVAVYDQALKETFRFSFQSFDAVNIQIQSKYLEEAIEGFYQTTSQEYLLADGILSCTMTPIIVVGKSKRLLVSCRMIDMEILYYIKKVSKQELTLIAFENQGVSGSSSGKFTRIITTLTDNYGNNLAGSEIEKIDIGDIFRSEANNTIEKLIDHEVINNEAYRSLYFPIIASGSQAFGGVISQRIESKQTDRAQLYFLIFSVALLILVVVSSSFVTKGIVLPIKALLNGIENLTARMKKGEPFERIQVKNRDEIFTLTKAFNAMGAELFHANSELKQSEESLRKSAEAIRKLNAELEQRVIERTAQLETTNKELEAFAYSISHDLRAPLRGIDGFSQALLEDYAGEIDAQGQDYLRRVRNASQRMGQLIDDLLKLSRLTRGEMRRETVDLSGMAQTIASELQKTQPERQVECLITPGLSANGDERLLRVVLENLLGNAWKFTSKYTQARIEFGATEVEGESAYFVRDNGAGFDMAYADKLFGAFQRLHSVTEFEGTGIGLATVQRIIHRHGGRVWAEGAVEQGATFYFTL